MERRKVTFKLYPSAREAERLTALVRLHCELYNAALQERVEAYRKVDQLHDTARNILAAR